jgi:hypothetical protein
VRDLNPKFVNKIRVNDDRQTSNGKLWATCDELQKFATILGAVRGHDLKKVTNTLAVKVKTVICLDGIHESYEC